MTDAELKGAEALAKMMSVKDLEWQIKNAKKLGTAALTPFFKLELAKRLKGAK